MHEDGRGVSIWDTFSHTPGKVYGGHTGDVACDHYHRYKDDIHLMKELGIQSYRFSVAWPRIFAEPGQLNAKGLDFYRRLVDELLKAGIRPAITLYHWDLPQYLQDQGGWVNRDTAHRFVEYAQTVFRALGKDVPMWITHNEPWCASFLSYAIGEHAPGHHDWREAIAAAHHILLSHGLAVDAFRAEFGARPAPLTPLGQGAAEGEAGDDVPRIGITLNLNHVWAASNSPEDEAARRRQDGFFNRWFLDPLFKGAYPADILEIYERAVGHLGFIRSDDLPVISRPIDFLGVNYYSRDVVAAGDEGLFKVRHVPGGGPVTAMGWEIHPESLYRLLSRIRDEYTALPIYITENGAACQDVVVNGRVEDPDRIAYLEAHLAQCLRFIEEGGNLHGYYVWSFLDNFEWAHGYTKRFGIVYVDYDTQARIPKASAYWYRDLIQANLAMV